MQTPNGILPVDKPAGWTSFDVLAKLRGTYRWHIVVKCPADADLSDALLPLFRRRKPDRDANMAVDVDPDDLL